MIAALIRLPVLLEVMNHYRDLHTKQCVVAYHTNISSGFDLAAIVVFEEVLNHVVQSLYFQSYALVF